MSPEEHAIEGEKTIKVCADRYRQVFRQLNESRDAAEDPHHEERKSTYKALLIETCDRARELFNQVESVISSTELLGCQRSDFWAKDLAQTAANVLDLAPSHFTRIREDFRDFFRENAPEPSHGAFYAMESAVTIHHPKRAKALREAFSQAHLPIDGFINPPKMNTRYSQAEKYIMYATAIFFVLVMLAIGVFMKKEDYNNANILIFRTVLALTAGAFGSAFISGFIEVQATWGNVAVKAAGAAAFFAVVYFANPPALVENIVATVKSHKETSVDVGDIKKDINKPRSTPLKLERSVVKLDNQKAATPVLVGEMKDEGAKPNLLVPVQ